MPCSCPRRSGQERGPKRRRFADQLPAYVAHPPPRNSAQCAASAQRAGCALPPRPNSLVAFTVVAAEATETTEAAEGRDRVRWFGDSTALQASPLLSGVVGGRASVEAVPRV
eukprot:CAMPEP_0119057172 /NCGR_PEP_ID=MMETSP1178-20130426/1691_1 /TAXON_ID=33656 /ORGANISM="unid sp, Strain CCMP2000" /LENGTH=111 /DNA_ID=CAMNT_0007037975 /DNA_START=113 /DNA_END=444 /DNA_ORIENTATION=+